MVRWKEDLTVVHYWHLFQENDPEEQISECLTRLIIQDYSEGLNFRNLNYMLNPNEVISALSRSHVSKLLPYSHSPGVLHRFHLPRRTPLDSGVPSQPTTTPVRKATANKPLATSLKLHANGRSESTPIHPQRPHHPGPEARESRVFPTHETKRSTVRPLPESVQWWRRGQSIDGVCNQPGVWSSADWNGEKLRWGIDRARVLKRSNVQGRYTNKTALAISLAQ